MICKCVKCGIEMKFEGVLPPKNPLCSKCILK